MVYWLTVRRLNTSSDEPSLLFRRHSYDPISVIAGPPGGGSAVTVALSQNKWDVVTSTFAEKDAIWLFWNSMLSVLTTNEYALVSPGALPPGSESRVSGPFGASLFLY